MRVEGTQGINPPNLPHDNRPAGKADVRGKVAAGQDTPDIEHSSASEPYIRTALATDEINLQAVAEAQDLLKSGQLDTPQAAQRAAEAIIRNGL